MVNSTPLTVEEQARLLRWARQAVAAAAQHQPHAPVPEIELSAGLCARHAAFVTLRRGGELRGCVGHMDFTRPVWENILAAARSAAVADSRFAPVTPAEVAELVLEISVLEPPVELADPAQFDPDRYGIIVERGGRSALLLPKVAREFGWNATQTLAMVCRKAGLAEDVWREPTTQLQVFTAFEFGEPAPERERDP